MISAMQHMIQQDGNIKILGGAQKPASVSLLGQTARSCAQPRRPHRLTVVIDDMASSSSS